MLPTCTQVPEPEDIEGARESAEGAGAGGAGRRDRRHQPPHLQRPTPRSPRKDPWDVEFYIQSATTDPAGWQRPQERAQGALKQGTSQQGLAWQRKCRERRGAGRPATPAVTEERRVERRPRSDLGRRSRADRGRGPTSPACGLQPGPGMQTEDQGGCRARAGPSRTWARTGTAGKVRQEGGAARGST